MPGGAFDSVGATDAHGATDGFVTGEAVGLAVRPASLILRAAGTVIDWLAYGGLLVLLLWAVSSLTVGLDTALVTALGTVALVTALVIAPMAVEVASHGRSLGRWAVGARIVRIDGGAAGLRHAFIRALVGVVEIFMTFGGMAALVALLDDRSRRVGDLLAGTYSQHERVPVPRHPVYGVPVELQAWAATADVARLPDPLARRVAAFLWQASRMTQASRDRLAAELADETAPHVWPLPETSPELFLAAVAALRRGRDTDRLTAQQAHLRRLAPQLSGLPHRFPDR